MKLKSLTLENFRQFYGKQGPIYFSDDGDKNVTIVFGANGSGKSALLNAFTWTLYDLTTPSFENPKHLLNEKAVFQANEGELIEARVQIEFEHENYTYKLSRTRVEKKIDEPSKTQVIEEATPELKIVDLAGETHLSENPEDNIEQVLPKRLYNFFFFDGERIEKIAKEDAYDEIENAIKNILGLQIIERAKSHLSGQVKRTLDNQLSDVGGSETKEIIQEIQQLEENKEEEEDLISLQENNIKADKESLEKVENRLRKRQDTREYQEQIDRTKREKDEAKEQIKEIKSKLKKLINDLGYSAFLQPTAIDIKNVIEEKREKGEIPSSIKDTFVNDLLDKGTCICGRSIRKEDDKKAHDEVKSWRDKAGQSDVEDAALSVGVQLEYIIKNKEEFYEKIRNLLTSKKDKEELVVKLNHKLSELDRKIGERDSEEVQELVDKKENLETRIKEAQQAIGAANERIKRLEEELDELEKEKEEAKAQSKEEEIIKKKSKIVNEALTFFKKVYDLRSEAIRKKLNEKVNEVFDKIDYKGYWTEITPDYDLLLKKKVGNEERIVSKSEGEAAVLSLSFIGSISNYARDLSSNSRKNDLLNFEGGTYPIIMDSPFGKLDRNYKESVCQGLPNLAEQVVVFVSKEQGLGKVLEELRPKMNKLYVITYNSLKQEHNKEEDFSFEGKQYPYIIKSSEEFEFASLTEVK